ncbi:MAG: AAA-like domain-containing protein [Treponema sp.]|nr:AAA-like domain-containing protein [Treponema sp.]
MRRFNTTGTCFADRHYMVNIDERVQQIKKMVDLGDYFCINRGRQYGKTTTLHYLKKALDEEYTVFSISFEGMSESSFSSLENCGKAFFEGLMECVDYDEVTFVDDATREFLRGTNVFSDDKDLSLAISKLCKANTRPVVVIIDEVDQAGNYEAFVKFLGLLRSKFLSRDTRPTFHSVILAGVYDIRNLKLKLRPEESHQYNSPWNIAASFDVSMELEEAGICGMLDDYEADHRTGMDTARIAKLISDYTSGYPFLVSRLCQIIDENLDRDWTEHGFLESVKRILSERDTLFDDMAKKLDSFPKVKQMLRRILYDGEKIPYNADDRELGIAAMFNYIKNDGGMVRLSNRIFETRMYNQFLFEAETSESEQVNGISRESSADKPLFIRDGKIGVRDVVVGHRTITEAVV